MHNICPYNCSYSLHCTTSRIHAFAESLHAQRCDGRGGGGGGLATTRKEMPCSMRAFGPGCRPDWRSRNEAGRGSPLGCIWCRGHLNQSPPTTKSFGVMRRMRWQLSGPIMAYPATRTPFHRSTLFQCFIGRSRGGRLLSQIGSARGPARAPPACSILVSQ